MSRSQDARVGLVVSRFGIDSIAREASATRKLALSVG